jgi:hypothetical protein
MPRILSQHGHLQRSLERTATLRSETRRDAIVSIEFAGPVTAFVHAKCAIGPRYFSDFLTLIRVDGRWQIISKVFHYEE